MAQGRADNDQPGERIAVITGGASGIGAVIARQLSTQGLRTVIADLDMDAAAKVAASLENDGVSSTAVRIDVGDADAVVACFREVEQRFGRCDVLVNSAGVARTFPFIDFPLDDWLRTMAINVTGALLCSQQAARLMAPRRWGRIVNIASVAGMRAVGTGRTAYGTSKGALIALTRQMAVELAPQGITANAVCPGPVDTPMTRVLHSEQFRHEYTRAIPMGRYGTPEEIAHATAFLASDGASYITGIAMPVDGGFLAAGARPD